MCAAKTLDGRLLCASECAYEIENPYFKGVGYVAGTTTKRISKGVNSCLVGRTIDGIVVAFRGTRSSSPLDWLQNAAIFLRSVKTIPNGKIHAGFYEAVQAMYAPVKRIILQMLEDTPLLRSKKIYLTGHSKGGCLASLTAVLMKQDKGLQDAHYVCSFGGARVGDAAFRSYFNKTIRQSTYENYLDVIPFLPPGNETMKEMDEDMTELVEK
jgi:predicted lipase